MNRLLLAAFVLFVSTSSWAGDLPTNEPNGCGTSGWGSIVPDSSLLTRCRFTEACNQHDVCYGRCLSGGDLFGQSTCSDRNAKVTRRTTCDTALYSNIALKNDDRAICKAYGSLYRWAVIRFGKAAFYGASGAMQQVDKLNEFLAYIDQNPNSFKLEELNTAFNLLASKPAQSSYMIEFDLVEPRLKILAFSPAGGMEVELDIKGIKP